MDHQLYLDIDKVAAIPNERLRNFIMATDPQDGETLKFIQSGDPSLFSDQPIKRVKLSSLLRSVYPKRMPTRKELKKGGSLLGALEKVGIPVMYYLVCDSIYQTYQASEDQSSDYTRLEREVYEDPADILSNKEYEKIRKSKVVGDKLEWRGNQCVVVHTASFDDFFIALAPTSLIEVDIDLTA